MEGRRPPHRRAVSDGDVKRWKRTRFRAPSTSGRSDITSADDADSGTETFELRTFHSAASVHSLAALLGDDPNADSFQREVAQKTQTHMVGKQEAENEVMIDRLIKKNGGSKDKALLFVLQQIPTEVKVHIFVNTLLHRGANPSTCDGDWDTPLHLAARRSLKGVVAKLLEHEALPDARNKAGKMALHIALDNNNDDIAAMLLAYMPHDVVRDLFTTRDQKVAECSLHALLRKNMQQTVLSVLDCMMDPIGQSGHVKVHYGVLEADEMGRPPSHGEFNSNSKSCLHLISKGGHKTICYHDAVRLLIRRKWKEYARCRFQLNSCLFIVTLVCLTFSAIVAAMASDPTTYDSPLQVIRAVFEVWSFAAALATFLIELNQMRKHRLDYWQDQFNWIDLLSSGLLLAVLPLRFTHSPEQWYLFSLGYLLWTLRIFKYAAVFRQTGAYSQILWRIVAHDFLQFTVVFTVILLAFSGSFVLALRGEDSLNVHNETSTFWDILFTGVRILIEGQPVVEYQGPFGYKPLGCILMVGFLFTCCVVLLNILIAQLSDTYQNVQRDAHRGLELNRAWIIARVEQNSIFIGKGYRVTKYLEAEEICSPEDVLEKWESPPLTEMNKYIRDIWDELQNHKLNLLTIKNRLSHQEYLLSRINQQLERVVPKENVLESVESQIIPDLDLPTSSRASVGSLGSNSS